MSEQTENADYAAVLDNLTEDEQLVLEDIINQIGDAIDVFNDKPAALIAPLAAAFTVTVGAVQPVSLRVALLNQFIRSLARELKVEHALPENQGVGVG